MALISTSTSVPARPEAGATLKSCGGLVEVKVVVTPLALSAYPKEGTSKVMGT